MGKGKSALKIEKQKPVPSAFFNYGGNMELEKELNALIDESHDAVALLIRSLDHDKTYFEKDAQVQLISASTIKVPIMLAVLESVLKEETSLDKNIMITKDIILDDSKVFECGEQEASIKELLYWMIINSDNTSTNALIHEIGMEKINTYIQTALHLKNTSLERYMLDREAVKQGFDNRMCHEDMYALFQQLFTHQILNDELCELAIQILLAQRQQNQLLRYVYQPIDFAHKTGDLDYLHHDVGVMKIQNERIYVGVSIYDTLKKEGNMVLMGKIGKLICECLNHKK